MENISIGFLVFALIILIFLSCFFSGAETGMMALNRYRLRHLVRQKNRTARRVAKMLERPERLLGVILIGNTFANVAASAIATIIAAKLYGELGIAIGTVLLTLILLVFAELTPKTIAAKFPQRIAFIAALPLQILLKLLYPLVWLSNLFSEFILRVFRTSEKHSVLEHLSAEELSTLVAEAGTKIPVSHQAMLLAILDLEKISVDDVMIPRSDIVGIDLEQDWQIILDQLENSQHTRLPIFQHNIDAVKGVLHVRKALNLLAKHQLNKNTILQAATEPYFIPEHTPASQQLINFRTRKVRMGFVVDEYGEIIGLLTLEDILEEIVGEFTTSLSSAPRGIQPQMDGSYIIDATLNIRDLNRLLGWRLPIDGPKTLSGLIIEYLEMMPKVFLCVKIANYPIEILEVEENRIKRVRVFKRL